DALGLLTLLTGLDLGARRCRYRRRDAGAEAEPARLRRPRLVNDVAFLVVQQLAHRERLNRNSHRLRPLRRRDLGGAGEAGAHFGNLAVERDHYFEVGGGARAGLLAAGGLDRAVADLGDVTGVGLALDRVDGDLGHLADPDNRDIGFVDFDFGFDDRHVSDGE